MSRDVTSPSKPGQTSPVDDRVQDPAALAEIEMYGELVVAATDSDGPLDQDQIDALLGVDRQPKRPEM